MVGFDFFLDDQMKPWLIETNGYPSLNGKLTDEGTEIDMDTVSEMLNIARIHVPEISAPLINKYRHSSNVKFDTRLYSADLSPKEAEKQMMILKTFSSDPEKAIQDVLKFLTPTDVRMLIRAEDELVKTKRFERIFPTSNMERYLKYFTKPRYSNILMMAWEKKYFKNRKAGRKLINSYCENNYHLT